MTNSDDQTRHHDASLGESEQRAARQRERHTSSRSVEVSLRKRAEKELEAAEERLHLMITTAKDYGFFLIDREGQITSWNSGAAKLFGWTEDEVLNQPFARLFTEEDRENGVPERELNLAAENGAADDDRWHIKKNGSKFWAHGITTALGNDSVQGFAKIVRDLTTQKRAEESLRKSEEQHRSLIEQVRDYAIFRTDTQGRATTWNRGVQRVLGFEEAEFLGVEVSPRIFTPEAIREGVPQKELEEAERTGVATNNRPMMKKDGTRFYAEGMTTALRDEQGELIGFTKVMQDKTEQKQQAEELAEKTRQLAAANKQKDRFLAVLSHELRNPLTPIRTATELICNEEGQIQVVEEACEILQRQVDVMVRLVDDLLEASRITSGKVRLRREILDLREVARRAVDTVGSLAKARGQQLSVSLPDEAIWLDADSVRIEQVIVNLLTNAAKYTPEGGNIWLSVQRQDDTGVVRVRDDGEGISSEVMPTLFTLFSQADRSLDNSAGGMGIGLALVASLVEMHGGTAEAHSEGAGKGSEFVVRLPVSARPASEDESGDAVPHSAASLRVLLVDDNADALKMLSMLLKRSGYDVRAETSGAAGLEAAEEFRPHVIILDIGMPGMNGHEFAQHVRSHPDLQNVRLVAVSGYGQDADRKQSKEVGIDEHLVKPVASDVLIKLLQEFEASLAK